MIRKTGTPWATIAGIFLGASLVVCISYESPRVARADATPAEQPLAEQTAAEQPSADEPAANGEQELSPEMLARLNSIQWQIGPTNGALGTIATIKVPEHYKLTTGAGAATLMEINENIPDPHLLGVLVPVNGGNWIMTFTYDDNGHVPDDDHEKLPADEILASYREGAEAANEDRKRRGWSEMHVTGWLQPPAYDANTKNLTWAILANSDGQAFANYDLRLLSRTGFMRIKLIASPDQITQLAPTAKQLIAGCEFTPGNKYGDFRAGDKVAEYGLIGLITGGAVIAAAKTGLLAKIGVMFAKFAKPILIGAAAVGAAIWKFFGWLVGAKTEPSEPN